MGPVRVFYDDQCEICQAGVSWLKILDCNGAVSCIPLSRAALRETTLDLNACERQLHIITPEGRILVGWNAVAYLARLFPLTWIIGALGAVPGLRWLLQKIYLWVAGNRYALSKCRGGACRVRNAGTGARAPLGALWTCYSAGLLLRLPLSLFAIVRQTVQNALRFFRVYGRRFEFLNGRLQILVLNGLPADLISLLFGEHFVAIVYDGIAIDPGSSCLRPALVKHLKRHTQINGVVATHHHEEHSGNLNWLAQQTGSPVYAGADTAAMLHPPARLPWIRRVMIGQPPPLGQPFTELGCRLGKLQAFPAPGHCSDHIVLYDAEEKILFAGDSFMGAYFSAPNPDVDSRLWMGTLQRLLELDVEVLVEGHGFIHTLRPEFPSSCPLVIRRDPREQIREKLRFCEWIQQQVEAGMNEGLPVRAIQATCFPWGRRFSWEGFVNDTLSQAFSAGHWSRTELVRSFVRTNDTALPSVYEVRIQTAPQSIFESGTSRPERSCEPDRPSPSSCRPETS